MNYLENIQKSLNYIEDNLTSNLQLESLARQSLLSPYYFHRIFQSLVGIPVMEHVRKRRLAHASYDLLNTEDTIITIAMKYQFNSHDVFVRAFKRYYGISPGKYRTLNKKSLSFTKPITFKEDNIMMNFEWGQRLASINNQDKAACLESLKTIIKLSEKAHKNGLLSLESEICESQSFLLNKALQFIIDGVQPEFIKSTLYNYIYTGNYSGKDLLERVIIIEGILSIQAGEDPLLIRERLSSYFGEGFAMEIAAFYEKDSNAKDKALQAYIDSVKDIPSFSSSTSLLEAPVQKMDDRSLQRLIREIDIHDLFTAIKGSSGKTQGKILSNISKKIAHVLIDELSSSRQPAPHEIIEAQNRIIEIMLSLKAANEIL